jgi:hypothetical protein
MGGGHLEGVRGRLGSGVGAMGEGRGLTLVVPVLVGYACARSQVRQAMQDRDVLKKRVQEIERFIIRGGTGTGSPVPVRALQRGADASSLLVRHAVQLPANPPAFVLSVPHAPPCARARCMGRHARRAHAPPTPHSFPPPPQAARRSFDGLEPLAAGGPLPAKWRTVGPGASRGGSQAGASVRASWNPGSLSGLAGTGQPPGATAPTVERCGRSGPPTPCHAQRRNAPSQAVAGPAAMPNLLTPASTCYLATRLADSCGRTARRSLLNPGRLLLDFYLPPGVREAVGRMGAAPPPPRLGGDAPKPSEGGGTAAAEPVACSPRSRTLRQELKALQVQRLGFPGWQRTCVFPWPRLVGSV